MPRSGACDPVRAIRCVRSGACDRGRSDQQLDDDRQTWLFQQSAIAAAKSWMGPTALLTSSGQLSNTVDSGSAAASIAPDAMSSANTVSIGATPSGADGAEPFDVRKVFGGTDVALRSEPRERVEFLTEASHVGSRGTAGIVIEIGRTVVDHADVGLAESPSDDAASVTTGADSVTDDAASVTTGADSMTVDAASVTVEQYVTYDPMDLEDRFRQRFRDGEKFEIVEFNWNGPIQMGNMNFDFEMTWSNPDLAHGPSAARGKGAIDCADAATIVWSLAMKPLSPGPTQNT